MGWIDELAPVGRVSRQGFWLRHLLVLPVALFLCIATTDLLGYPFGLLPALVTTIGLVSAWGRRLHDRGRSAWWLLATALPVIGALWLLVECALRGCAAGAERYGPAPDSRSDYATVGAEPTP